MNLKDMLAGARPAVLGTVVVVEERLACSPAADVVAVVLTAGAAVAAAVVAPAEVPNPPNMTKLQAVLWIRIRNQRGCLDPDPDLQSVSRRAKMIHKN
jgi:hypothetical protein